MEFRLLRADEIDVKIKQVTEKGAIALLYKTARTDMAILDETFGVLNWTDDYKEIKGNLYCGIGVRDQESKPFIWKWDCGIESREDEEGNQKKGEASDAFKRAGTKLGIGRELYTSPFIFLQVETQGDVKKWQLKNKYQSFSVKEIDYNEKREISLLKIVNDKNEVVFTYGTGASKPKIAQTSQVKPKVEQVSNEQLTLAQALNLTFKSKDGRDIMLKELDVIQLSKLLRTENPEFEQLRKGANLILEFKANTEGKEDE